MFGLWWIKGIEVPGLSLSQFCYNGKASGQQTPKRNINSSKKFIFTCYVSSLLQVTEYSFSYEHCYFKYFKSTTGMLNARAQK